MGLLFIIGLILLSINVFRFISGNYIILKNKEIPIALRLWNVVETVGIGITLLILILHYYGI